MHTNRHWLLTFIAGACLVLVTLAWIFFAPKPLGGQASYVMVTGNSMEPLYQSGDLVIVRSTGTYNLGDIVTYRDPQLERYVIHRIVSRTPEGFILKGDHNNWLDSYQPAAAEIVGREWLRIPAAGTFITWVRNPWIITLVIGITGGAIMAVLLTRPKNKKDRKRKSASSGFKGARRWFAGLFHAKDGNNPTPASASSQPRPGGNGLAPARKTNKVSQVIEVLFFVLGFVAIASLVLGIFSLANPVQREATNDISYQQTGNYSYSGTAPKGVYDSEKIVTGQPFFPKLTCTMSLQFDYQLSAPLAEGISGSHQLTAVVTEIQSNWKRAINLEPKRNFSGNSFSATAIVNLCDVESLVARFEAQTGLKPPSYMLEIQPNVTINGTLGDLALADTFNEALQFQFDKVQFFVFQPDPQKDPLNPVKTGMLKNTNVETNSLNIFGWELPVKAGRLVSLLGLCLSLAGIGVLFGVISQAARQDGEVYTRMKYGSMLVDVRGHVPPSSSRIVDVLSMDDLAKMAEKSSSVILHETRGVTHDYYLQDGNVTYHFSTGLRDEHAAHPGHADHAKLTPAEGPVAKGKGK